MLLNHGALLSFVGFEKGARYRNTAAVDGIVKRAALIVLLADAMATYWQTLTRGTLLLAAQF
jgi:hypothetical protein